MHSAAEGGVVCRLQALLETLLAGKDGEAGVKCDEWRRAVAAACGLQHLLEAPVAHVAGELVVMLQDRQGGKRASSLAFAAATSQVAEFSGPMLDEVLPAAVDVVRLAVAEGSGVDTKEGEEDSDLIVPWFALLCHHLSSCEMNIAEIYDARVVALLLTAVMQRPLDSTLLRCTARCLAHFSCYDIQGAAPVLHGALQYFRDDATVQADVIQAVGELAVHRNQEVGRRMQHELGRLVVPALLAAAERHCESASVVTAVADALANLADGCDDNVKHMMTAQPHAPAVLLAALASHLHHHHHHTQEPSVCCAVFSFCAKLPEDAAVKAAPQALQHLRGRIGAGVMDGGASTEAASCLHLLAQCGGRGGGEQEALELLRMSPSPAVHRSACALIASLKHEPSEEGVVPIVGSMLRHMSDISVQTAAISALSRIASSEKGQHAILKTKGVPAVVAALRRFISSAQLQEVGAVLLTAISWSTEGKAEVVSCGGVEVLLEALSRHLHALGVQRHIALCLSQIAFGTEHYRDLIGNFKGVAALTESLQNHQAFSRVAGPMLCALSYLTWGSDGNTTDFLRCRGLPTVLTVMELHPDVTAVQTHACRLLGNVPFGKEGWEVVTHAIVRTSHCLQLFEETPDLAEEAARAVVTLAQSNQRAKLQLSRRGCVRTLVGMLRKYPNMPAVQQEACTALAHLSYDSEELTREITRYGGVAVCLNAMRCQQHNMKVLIAACNALSGLAFNNTEGQRQILEQDGVRHIIAAMRSCDRMKMQDVGCLVLGTLSWNDRVKEEVAAKGGMTSIVEALSRYQDHAGIQKNGCRAISQLAYNSEKNRDELYRIGGVRAVLSAMKMHSKNDKLLLHACVALTYLSWRSEPIVEEIVDNDGAMVVQQVIDTFRDNGKLRRKAEHLKIILSRRPSTGGPMPQQHQLHNPHQHNQHHHHNHNQHHQHQQQLLPASHHNVAQRIQPQLRAPQPPQLAQQQQQQQHQPAPSPSVGEQLLDSLLGVAAEEPVPEPQTQQPDEAGALLASFLFPSPEDEESSPAPREHAEKENTARRPEKKGTEGGEEKDRFTFSLKGFYDHHHPAEVMPQQQAEVKPRSKLLELALSGCAKEAAGHEEPQPQQQARLLNLGMGVQCDAEGGSAGPSANGSWSAVPQLHRPLKVPTGLHVPHLHPAPVLPDEHSAGIITPVPALQPSTAPPVVDRAFNEPDVLNMLEGRPFVKQQPFLQDSCRAPLLPEPQQHRNHRSPQQNQNHPRHHHQQQHLSNFNSDGPSVGANKKLPAAGGKWGFSADASIVPTAVLGKTGISRIDLWTMTG